MLQLRADLLRRCDGPLPAHCRLPKHYSVVVETPRTHCEACGCSLRRQRTRTRFPVGVLLGEPQLIHREKQCPECQRVYHCEELTRLLPRHSNYAFDLVVEVGLRRFREHQQGQEIQAWLRTRYGLDVPETTVHHLVDRFLAGIAAVHEASAPQLTERFRQGSGGYVLHLDGTCEAGTSVLFLAVDGETGWTLGSTKMPSESATDIQRFLEECLRVFGRPLATVRDLSENIRLARDAVLSDVPDFVCEYHLLANIGERLCKSPRAALARRLRHHGVRTYLTATRRELNSRNKRGEPIPPEVYEAFLRDPTEGFVSADSHHRRLLVFTLIRWIEDAENDLSGEYFPFDQPELAFYRRCQQMFDWLQSFLQTCSLSWQARRMFDSLRGALTCTRQDPLLVAAAQRLEKAAESFDELRCALRLEPAPGRCSLLRQHPPRPQTPAEAEQANQRLQDYRKRLGQVLQNDADPERVHDAKSIANQLDKYWDRLPPRVLTPTGKDTPLVVKRTNNPPEHRFAGRKCHWRRQTGNGKLAKRLEAAQPAEFLVDNLTNDTYLEIVYNGSLDNMTARFAEHWPHAAQTQRDKNSQHSKQSAHTDSRLRVRKSVLRSTGFFDTMTHALSALR